MVCMAGEALRLLGSYPFCVLVNTALQTSCDPLYFSGMERSWLFRYVISASIYADFRMIPHESASHSRDYEHTPRIVGK